MDVIVRWRQLAEPNDQVSGGCFYAVCSAAAAAACYQCALPFSKTSPIEMLDSPTNRSPGWTC